MAGRARRSVLLDRRAGRVPAVIRLLGVCALLLVGVPAPAFSQSLPSQRDTSRIERDLPHGRGTVAAPAGNESFLDAVVRAIEADPDLPALPVGLPTGVRIEIATTQEEFERFSGGRPPEWAAGIAIPSVNRIVLPAWGGGGRNRAALAGTTLRHEWAHLGLHQHMGRLRIPRWFSEGYAQWAAGWDRGSAWRLRLLVAAGRTPPLDSLTLRFPDQSASAEVAYLLSATMVEYLVDASGVDGLEIFLARWREEGRFDAALARTYGLTPGRLEVAWRRWLRDRYGWVWLIGSSGLGWAFLAILALWLYRIRRRRDREGMARLRADILDSDDPWWEPGDAPPGSPGEAPARTSRAAPPRISFAGPSRTSGAGGAVPSEGRASRPTPTPPSTPEPPPSGSE